MPRHPPLRLARCMPLPYPALRPLKQSTITSLQTPLQTSRINAHRVPMQLLQQCLRRLTLLP